MQRLSLNQPIKSASLSGSWSMAVLLSVQEYMFEELADSNQIRFASNPETESCEHTMRVFLSYNIEHLTINIEYSLAKKRKWLVRYFGANMLYKLVETLTH